MNVSFDEVLKFFEKHGWELYGSWGPFHVFRNPKNLNAPTWFVEVKDGKVFNEDFDKIKKFFS